MSIKILNHEKELESFPNSQSIFLYSSEELELTSFKDNIVLFRIPSNHQLISLAEPYSYNIGHIKESFDNVSLSFIVEDMEGGFKITCTPDKKLNLDSTYCLYISKKLSQKSLTVTKLASKSKSDIKVYFKHVPTNITTYSFKIEDTSAIVGGKNILKYSLNGVTKTIDIRASNTVILDSLEISLEDTIYVKGEEFNITYTPSDTLGTDLVQKILTVNSASISPIPNEEISTRVTNSSVLDFYKNLNATSTPIVNKAIPKYLSSNLFSIPLPDGYKLDTSVPTFKSTLKVAFNNYLLSSLNLFNSDQKYIIYVFFDDFENAIVFEVVYSNNLEQEDTIVFNLEGYEYE